MQKLGTNNILLANQGIKIYGHAHLRAEVNLHREGEATRGSISDEQILSHLFDEEDILPLDFNAMSNERSRGGTLEPLHILEFADIERADALNAEHPLRLELDADLQENELLLPFTFDGEDVLPIGDSQRSETGQAIITIDKFPAPQTRSLSRAFKLSFYKISSTLFKIDEDNLFQLRKVDYSTSKIKYKSIHKDASELKEAKKVLLVIHGILGNTLAIAKAARPWLKTRENDSGYDLVLSYDYENLNTPIAQIAQELYDRLAGNEGRLSKKDQPQDGLGFGEHDGKELHLLVHSMGGLVARYMIEQLNGKAFVNKLVMCGTPNGGSPFGEIDYYRRSASIMLGLGLAGLGYAKAALGAAAWFVRLKSVQSGLADAGVLTQTLENMRRESNFIFDLNHRSSANNAEIPYYILAANMLAIDSSEDPIFQRIIQKLLDIVGFAVFGKNPNDVAVAVKDILEPGKNMQVETYNLAGHHLDYFTNPNSVQILNKILA